MDMQVNYGILALVPPIIAIGLCFATKQVLISMFAGLFAGSLIISSWNRWGMLLCIICHFMQYGG